MAASRLFDLLDRLGARAFARFLARSIRRIAHHDRHFACRSGGALFLITRGVRSATEGHRGTSSLAPYGPGETARDRLRTIGAGVRHSIFA